MKTVTDFRRQITVNGDSRHGIKRCLLLGRKAVINLGSELKGTDITLPTMVPIVKVMVFPVAMYRCESWTIKKTECQRTAAFELWCWRLSRVPWTTRRSSQSILKKNQCSLKGLMLKLKLQYFGHLMRRADSFEKTLMLRKTEGRRRRGRQRMRWLDASPTGRTWVWVSSGSWWWTGRPVVHGVAKSRTQLNDWTTTESGSFTLGCSRFLSFFQVETESCLRSKQVLVREKDPLLSGLPWCSGGDASTSSYAGLNHIGDTEHFEFIIQWPT